MTEKTVHVECLNGIAVVSINRPEIYNSFDLETASAFTDAVSRAAADDNIHGVVVTGKGRAFCTGGDVRWMAGFGDQTGSALRRLAGAFHQGVIEIRRMAKPVVAAVNGAAAGGGFSLALACDFRIIERSAVLRQAYTSNGLSIDGGGSFMLPRLVGQAKAMEILAFDRPIDSEKALAWGLATEIADDGKSISRAIETAEKIAGGARTSFAASKRLIALSAHSVFEEQLEVEREMLAACGEHPNGREGVTAFIEKRPARFNIKDR
ncbi:MAG TPA: enoyl-CoA hydratase/isomerase family protein [Desulfobacteraceae bacterium]|nr:enoyl-CoA hydratase/isomerase family protein [Desulfobacteraceae bacterium]